MKQTYLLFAFIGMLFFFPQKSFSQNQLEIQIINLKNDQGDVLLEVFNEHNEPIFREIGAIKERESIIVITDLKDGMYAVWYFHDENSNRELDTNFMGIPTEGYGISNDAYGSFGPKSFEKWLFPVTADTLITLTTKN